MTRPRALVAGAVVLVLLAGLLGLAARDDPAPEFTVRKVHGVPFLDDATSGPGTALGAGLRVPPGARLLGTTLPIEIAALQPGGTFVPDDGFQAWVFVTGDPIAVLRSLASQARSRGMRVGGIACPHFEPSPLALCSFLGRRDQGGRMTWVTATLRRGRDKALESPFSYVVIEFHDHLTYDLRLEGVEQRDDLVPMPPLARSWPALPGPGDELALAPGRDRQLRVEPGTHVVAPYAEGCAATYNAVLAVEGDPMQVMRAYSRQVAALDRTPAVGESRSRVRERRDGDARVLEFNQVAKYEQYLGHLVIRPGQPKYLFIETCMSS